MGATGGSATAVHVAALLQELQEHTATLLRACAAHQVGACARSKCELTLWNLQQHGGSDVQCCSHACWLRGMTPSCSWAFALLALMRASRLFTFAADVQELGVSPPWPACTLIGLHS